MEPLNTDLFARWHRRFNTHINESHLKTGNLLNLIIKNNFLIVQDECDHTEKMVNGNYVIKSSRS